MTHCKWLCAFLLVAALSGQAFGQERPVPLGSDPSEDAPRALLEPEPEPEEVEVTSRGKPRGIELGNEIYGYGSLSAAYVRNLGDPLSQEDVNGVGRLSDPDHHKVGLSYVQLGLARTVSGRNEFDAGFRIEIGAGRLADKVLRDDGLLDDQPFDLPQVYGQLQLATPLGRPVVVSAGRMASWFGSEGLELSKNLNFSLGYLMAFGPKTFTGASLGIELADGVSYTQYVGQGWDVVDDNNDSKTVGGALRVNLGDLALRGSWILGAEGAKAGDQRWAVGFDAAYVLFTGTELRAAGMYGEEEGGHVHTAGLARFGGLSLALKQGFLPGEGGFDRLSLCARGEWFRDQGGSRSGRSQTLAGVTATLEVRPIEAVALRAEYRHDWSSDDVFTSSSGARDEQDTIALELSLSF